MLPAQEAKQMRTSRIRMRLEMLSSFSPSVEQKVVCSRPLEHINCCKIICLAASCARTLAMASRTWRGAARCRRYGRAPPPNLPASAPRTHLVRSALKTGASAPASGLPNCSRCRRKCALRKMNTTAAPVAACSRAAPAVSDKFATAAINGRTGGLRTVENAIEKNCVR